MTTKPSSSSESIADALPWQEKSAGGLQEGVDDLTFGQAQTALELTLAQLQSSDLDVEAMAGLYRRALAYADRCQAVLETVEQEVTQWDPDQPANAPRPLDP